MIDSWGKIPSGLMKGNFRELGNYEECINFNTKLPLPFGQLEGQYCQITIPLIQSNLESSDTYELTNRMNENFEIKSHKMKLKNGICIPKSCTVDDIKKVLPFKVTSCKSKKSIPFESLDYVAM